VKTVYVPGDRRDYFEAESALRKIVTGFVNEQVRPHLENGKERMARLESLVENSDPDCRDYYADRVDQLKKWQKRANSLLPFALNFIKPE
jgi:DNA-binding transcriptional regulator GbsR (MarR family)